jgi:hypothetical protein
VSELQITEAWIAAELEKCRKANAIIVIDEVFEPGEFLAPEHPSPYYVEYAEYLASARNNYAPLLELVQRVRWIVDDNSVPISAFPGVIPESAWAELRKILGLEKS